MRTGTIIARWITDNGGGMFEHFLVDHPDGREYWVCPTTPQKTIKHATESLNSPSVLELVRET